MAEIDTEPAATDAAAVRARLAAVERRIDTACERAGRDRGEVTLVPVTKTVPVGRIVAAVDAGYRVLAENRVQEALAKARALAGRGVRWHLVGHLQRNKVAQALELAHCIESVDRERLVTRLAERLARAGERREILLQVNTSGAASQYGVTPDGVDALARAVAARPELDWTGLMTIGRLSADPEGTRDCFAELRRLRDRLEQDFGQPLPVLSMGMSGDLEVAVEEGATRVRVGSAIFGPRD